MSIYHSAVDVGTPPLGINSWETTEVRIHGFADAPATREVGHCIASPTFKMCGLRWRLRLFPGGTAHANEGMCSAVLLGDRSGESVEVGWGLSVKDADGRLVANVLSKRMENIESPRTGSIAAVCVHDFAPHSKLLDAVQHGTLVVEVRLRLIQPSMSPPPQPPLFVYPNPFSKKMLKLFLDEKSADVSFEVVSEKDDSHAPKRAKTPSSPAAQSTATFHAHRLILQECAPLLADLCASGSFSTAVPIPDVKPDIFRLLLYNVYGGEVTEDDLVGNVTDIIDAADTYGVVNLKMKAEAYYVRSNTITAGNMMEHLLYADAKNLALLHEAVVDFIVENNIEVPKIESFEHRPGDVAKDILIAMARKQRKGSGASDVEDQFVAMRISELRKKLDEKGLDVDGSRRVLIAALKEHSSN